MVEIPQAQSALLKQKFLAAYRYFLADTDSMYAARLRALD